VKKTDYYPWYEWTEEMVWEDDEFEDRRFGTLAERASQDGTGNSVLQRPDEQRKNCGCHGLLRKKGLDA